MNHNKKTRTILYAWEKSIPVLPGYIFLGIAFGLMLQNAGYHFIWALAISTFVYAGSMQFVLVSLLSGGVGLLYTAMMTFFVNGRHIFYGLSFIERYRNMGKKYPYMIFSLTDETYSLLCTLNIEGEVEEKQATFLISLFNHLYWITGSVIGAVVGELITFDATGIDFSMTALFVAIVVEQWQGGKTRVPALAGGISALLFLLLLGPDKFLLPALAVTVGFLLFIKKSEISLKGEREK